MRYIAERSEPYSLRLPPSTLRRLKQEARRRRVAPRTLAQDLVEEGLRMRRHPIVRFVDWGAGPVARVVGRRLRVTDVVEWVRGSDSLDAVCEGLQLSRGELDQVLAYYAEHRDEIDAEIERLHEESDHEYRLWREHQPSSGR